MANIINTLTARIEEYRETNKTPCKNFGSQAAAERATAKMAQDAANYFAARGAEGDAQPADYVVFYNEAWERWVGCINLSELMRRKDSSGGYMGFCKGFFTW